MRFWTVAGSVLFMVPASVFAQTNAPASGFESQTGTVGKPHNCAAFYPRDLERQGIGGETTLGFTITSDGSVRNIKIVKSSGNRELDHLAGLCASHWHYLSANGNPIEVQWKAKIVWSVPPEPSPAPSESDSTIPNQ
jgi:TonB family protein